VGDPESCPGSQGLEFGSGSRQGDGQARIVGADELRGRDAVEVDDLDGVHIGEPVPQRGGVGGVVDEDVVGADLGVLVPGGSRRKLGGGVLDDEPPVLSPEGLCEIPGVVPDGVGTLQERDELEDPDQSDPAPWASLVASRVWTSVRSSSVSARW
jgi:hypothetical protein